MKEITISQGKTVIVDDEDYARLAIHRWSCRGTGYAIRGFRKNGTIQYLKMHHAVVGKPPKSYVVDHINGNRLDNRKCNLRFVTNQQNLFNRQKIVKENSSSHYKGVSRMPGRNKWRSRIMISGKEEHLGCYSSEREAALAYNKAAIEYHGEYANLNKIQEEKDYE